MVSLLVPFLSILWGFLTVKVDCKTSSCWVLWTKENQRSLRIGTETLPLSRHRRHFFPILFNLHPFLYRSIGTWSNSSNGKCLLFLVITVTEYLTKQLKGRRFHSSWLTVGLYSSSWRTIHGAGHTTSTVRKQRTANAGAQHTFFFFFSPEFQPMGWCCPHLGWVFQLQLTYSKNFLHKHSLRLVS